MDGAAARRWRAPTARPQAAPSLQILRQPIDAVRKTARCRAVAGSRSSNLSLSSADVDLRGVLRTLLPDTAVANEMEEAVTELQGRLHHLTHLVGDLNSALAESTTRASPLPPAPPAALPATVGATVEVPGSLQVGSTVRTSTCTIQHPGALCCTTTTVAEDLEAGTFSVGLETTAHAIQGDSQVHRLVSAEELAALAATALEAAAEEHVRSRNAAIQAHSQPADISRRHAELCALLARGEIVSAERNSVTSEFGHESFIVKLWDRATRRSCKAVFKPKVEGDAGGWHRAPCEWLAYRLNVLLGLDLVPPVAYRCRAAGTGPVVLPVGGEQLRYEEGAMMYFVEEARPLCTVPPERWGADKEMLLSDTRTLDVILHNSDRHHGHFLLGQHWAKGGWDGDGRWDGDVRPVLIDHAAAFRAEACVTMTHENAFQTGPVRRISASTYLRLRFLDRKTMQEEFGHVLSEAEVAAMAARRDAVLRYLDGLVSAGGYAAVVQE